MVPEKPSIGDRSKVRIALVGGGGQLAADLRQALTGHDVVGLARPTFDLHDADSIARELDPWDWDAVLNTAAYNLVDQAEKDPADAFATNAIGTAHLARYCGRRNLRLIHFSTDFVFGLDPHQNRPWREDDPPGPVSVYGMSKLVGEYAVRTYAPNHLVLRTCGLYGHRGSRGKGGNFVETMLRLAGAGKPVRVVGDQRCTPSFTRDVAGATAQLLGTSAQGVLHLTNAGQCSWFEFACAIFEKAGLVVDCQQITSAEFQAPARRPAYSVLDLAQVHRWVSPMPDWKDALTRYLADRPTAPATP
jgi:dTDP-4-dehydrorhamnose reductase